MRILFLAVLFGIVSTLALAQQQPPTRAVLDPREAEALLTYRQVAIDRMMQQMQDGAKRDAALADYWKAYVAGLGAKK